MGIIIGCLSWTDDVEHVIDAAVYRILPPIVAYKPLSADERKALEREMNEVCPDVVVDHKEDMIATCRKCHNQLDKRRREEAKVSP